MSDLSQAKGVSFRNEVSPEEWAMRVDVAACYRLVALHGMNDLVCRAEPSAGRGRAAHQRAVPARPAPEDHRAGMAGDVANARSERFEFQKLILSPS
jgi:hypothetical protein